MSYVIRVIAEHATAPRSQDKHLMMMDDNQEEDLFDASQHHIANPAGLR